LGCGTDERRPITAGGAATISMCLAARHRGIVSKAVLNGGKAAIFTV